MGWWWWGERQPAKVRKGGGTAGQRVVRSVALVEGVCVWGVAVVAVEGVKWQLQQRARVRSRQRVVGGRRELWLGARGSTGGVIASAQ